MWKSLFIALGIFVFLLGAQCLATQKFVMRPQPVAANPPLKPDGTPAPPAMVQKEITPRVWAPWGLMALGIVVFGYSCTLPRRG
jgi:hypothetical protein